MATREPRPRRQAERPAIFGRQREQLHLRDILDDAMTGRGSLVLISGEAGIGKTTLVEDLVQHAKEQGCLVLTGGCYDLTTTPPYGPWAEALSGYHPDDGDPGLPPWFGNPDELTSIGSQAALFDDTRRFFEEIAERQSLVIVLEDLHWTDAASLEALRYLARTLRETAILLIITYREDEITWRHDLYQLLPVLVRENQAERIRVGGLERDALRALVQAQYYGLAGADTDRLVHYLIERSEGNPLFATEILRGLEDEAILSPSDTGWSLGALDQAHLPALLRQFLDTRLRRLSNVTYSALQLAAVIGQEIPLDLWQAIAGLNESDVDRIIAEAIEANLLSETPGNPTPHFRHALIRATLYESLIVSRRRVWHRRIGEALAATQGADPDATAFHFVQAMDQRAVTWLIRAGVRAEGQYALVVAASRYETAQILMEPDPAMQPARGWLLAHIGHLLRYTDRDRGLAYLDDALAIAQQTSDPIMAAQSQSHRGTLYCLQGDYQRGLADMEQAYRAGEVVSPEQEEGARQAIASLFPAGTFSNPRLISGGSLAKVGILPGINIATNGFVMQLQSAGRFHRAIEIGERYVEDVARATDNRALVQDSCRDAYRGLSDAYAALGQPERAEHWWQQAYDAFRAINHRFMIAGTLQRRSWNLLVYVADDVGARRHASEVTMASVTAMNEALHADFPVGILAIPLHVLEGRWNRVRELAQDRRKREWPFQHAWLRAIDVLAREDEDPAAGWTEVRHRFPNLRPEPPGNGEFFHSIDAHIVAATLCLDAASLDEAERWLESLDHWLEWSGAVLGRAQTRILWARYHRIAGNFDKAADDADQALTCASSPRQPLALIATHRFLGELAIESTRHEDAQGHLQAALELAARCEAPYEQALTKPALAELAIACGDIQETNRRLREVRAICEPLQAKRSLKRADQIEQRLPRSVSDFPAGLSSREVEVLEQTATGMTNAEIGDVLYISPRTVAQHLRSAYNKLGVNSRAAAVARWVELTSS